jgi:hypothetical protein
MHPGSGSPGGKLHYRKRKRRGRRRREAARDGGGEGTAEAKKAQQPSEHYPGRTPSLHDVSFFVSLDQHYTRQKSTRRAPSQSLLIIPQTEHTRTNNFSYKAFSISSFSTCNTILYSSIHPTIHPKWHLK